MTSQPGHPARREPLLWIQLLGLAALPLEALLLLVLLAGADPGLFPGFERLLTWALGALAPAVLFWRLPPDLWSLLLLQVPLRGRRPDQLRLSALQTSLPLKLLAAAGSVLLLPLVWWADAAAGLAWAWSPLNSSPRLVVLLLAVPTLALMQWQWHQVLQSLWMLSRSAALIAQTLPLSQSQASEQRLNLGLPLLLLAPLLESETRQAAPTPIPEAETTAQLTTEPEASGEPATELDTPTDSATESTSASANQTDSALKIESETQSDAADPEPLPGESRAERDSSVAAGVDGGVAIEPEQGAEETQSSELDS